MDGVPAAFPFAYLIIVIIFVAQLLVCHSGELLEALEKTTNMTEEQLKQVGLRIQQHKSCWNNKIDKTFIKSQCDGEHR